MSRRKENTMKNWKRILMAVAVIALASVPALAGGAKVIANPSVKADSVSADELKSVFLEETSSLKDGSHVEPVLAKGGAAHEAFLQEYLGKSDSALQTYYRSLVFTGKGSMPKTVGSDADVVAYVAKTKGAIGYVSSGTSAEGVKTLEVK
jgi:ABC-type phosphate transport system substrate-binding protein